MPDKRKHDGISDEEAERQVEEDIRRLEGLNRAVYELERRLSAERRLRQEGSGDARPSTSSNDPVPCTACGGTGKLTCEQCDGRGWFYNARTGMRERDGACNESGYLECRSCRGTGYR